MNSDGPQLESEARQFRKGNAAPSTALGRRLVRWVTYNLGVALIPLVASIAIHWLTAKLTWNAIANSPEILFFTLVVCASAMGDLSESTAVIGRTVTASILYSGLLLGLISSAILYGCLLYDGIAGPGSIDFRLQLLRMSVTLAVVFFLVSTIAEIYMGRNEANS